MRKLIGVILFSLYSSIVPAQNANVVLFTEGKEKFVVKLNGIVQNSEPATNLKITGLKDDFYKLNLRLENSSSGEIQLSLALEQEKESTYSIRKNANNQYVLRFISQVPLKEASHAVPEQMVVEFQSATSENTPPQSTQVPPASEVILNPEQDIDTDINLVASGNESNGCESVTSSLPVSAQTDSMVNIPSKATYAGPVGCATPITNEKFAELLRTVDLKRSEETKLAYAKLVISDYCFMTCQVKELCEHFSFEENRMEIAKAAYAHTYDIGNYAKLNDVFNFESSVEELRSFTK